MTERRKRRNERIHLELVEYAADILDSEHYQSDVVHRQHADVDVPAHTMSVACMSLRIAMWPGFRNCDRVAIARGGLLHDFYGYEWHDKSTHPDEHHGTTHASKALVRASEYFSITPKEADIIKRHMFPVNIDPPHSREELIINIADKICAIKETFSKPFYYAIIEAEKSKWDL